MSVKVRWSFFFSEGHICSDEIESLQDAKLQHSLVHVETGFIELPSENMRIWINLDHVKCAIREEVDKLDSRCYYKNEI